jgi:hypothetical protein
MDFYDINCLGKIRIERLAALPSWDTDDEGRMVYLDSTEELFYGDGTAWIGIDAGSAYTKAESDSRFLRKDSPGVDEDVYGCKTFCSGVDVYGNSNFCQVTPSTLPTLCVAGCQTGNCYALNVTQNCTGGRGAYITGQSFGTALKLNTTGAFSTSVITSSCDRALYVCTCSNSCPAITVIGCGTSVIYACNFGITGSGIVGKACCVGVKGCASMCTGLCGYAGCCDGVSGYAVCSRGIYGQSSNGTGIYGCGGGNNGGVYGRTASQCGVIGYASGGRSVAGNDAYYNYSSRHIKHLCKVCVTECLRNKPLKIYKYTHDDSNSTGFDEFIGPTAEEYHKTFELDHDDFGDDYLGLSGVSGTALGLAIENMDKIDILKIVLKNALKRLKVLEEKKDGSTRKIKQK